MPDKTRAIRKLPFQKDSGDKSLVLREVQFQEVRKSLIRKETLVLEPRTDQVWVKSVTRLDDSSKPWYITHV